MLIYYAIKINGKYFVDFKYECEENKGRHGGTHTNCGVYDYPCELVLVDEIINTTLFTSRCIGGKISNILTIDTYKDKKIEIIPVKHRGAIYGD